MAFVSCRFCVLTFDTDMELAAHLQNVHARMPDVDTRLTNLGFWCGYKNCQFSCDDASTLKSHDYHQHAFRKEERGLFVCPVASIMKCRAFSKRSAMKTHFRGHFKSSNYHCTLCSFEASTKNAQKKHMQWHTSTLTTSSTPHTTFTSSSTSSTHTALTPLSTSTSIIVNAPTIKRRRLAFTSVPLPVVNAIPEPIAVKNRLAWMMMCNTFIPDKLLHSDLHFLDYGKDAELMFNAVSHSQLELFVLYQFQQTVNEGPQHLFNPIHANIINN